MVMFQRNRTKRKSTRNGNASNGNRDSNLHAQQLTRNQRYPRMRIYVFIATLSLIVLILFIRVELYQSQSSTYTLFENDFADTDSDTEQYLLYFSHSGFSNQLQGLQGAARLALATNRTLVLPPLLPHSSTDKKTLSYPLFRARAAGNNCRAWREYSNFQEWVHRDVMATVHVHAKHYSDLKSLSQSQKNPFPSYKALIDVDVLAQSTGLKIIDMPEFANEKKDATNYNNWCKGDDTIRNKMVNGCGDKATFLEMVSAFRKACGRGSDSAKNRNSRIAVIGSGFVLPRIIPNPNYFANAKYFGETVGGAMDDFFYQLPSSPEFTSLLREMYALFPSGYVGVHIRFRDKMVIDDCDDAAVVQTYADILRDLNAMKTMHGKGSGNENENENHTTTRVSHVLIGNGNKAALRCFDHHSKGLYTATTVNQLIESNGRLQAMLNGIPSEQSTIYLLMDLILLGLADQLAFAHLDVVANTFQFQIKSIHKYKDVILKRWQG